jgi:hypothetical protein
VANSRRSSYCSIRERRTKQSSVNCASGKRWIFRRTRTPGTDYPPGIWCVGSVPRTYRTLIGSSPVNAWLFRQPYSESEKSDRLNGNRSTIAQIHKSAISRDVSDKIAWNFGAEFIIILEPCIVIFS